MFKKLVTYLESKLLAKYLQYKINLLLEDIMQGRTKAIVRVAGVEILMVEGQKEMPIKNIKVGELAVEQEIFQERSLEEMRAGCEILPGLLGQVSTVLREELVKWNDTVTEINEKETEHVTLDLVEENLKVIRQEVADLKTKLNLQE